MTRRPATCSASLPSVRAAPSRSNCAPAWSRTPSPAPGTRSPCGDYRNRDGSCGSAKEAWYDFTILPASAKPTQPPTTKPGGPGKPGGTAEPSQSAASGGGTGGSDSTGGLSPQDGAHLAATGSSSTLPAIALAGGAAMVVGAGAVIAVRRRKGVAGPGATDVTA